ncbi:extracellular solute-binding protein [uncultured Sphaerochaeta sp.]|uniref:extracellular solute-binding protein n=1 Tax=uncultured Sphaerochaeta sp. TaxID=886478 RepID=UPI002A0A7AA1|nr:extracellular solute-binding protein [uncultured Sphaerochaeta sp.]
MKKLTVFLLCLVMTMSFAFANGTAENSVAPVTKGPLEITFWHALGDARRSGWIQERVDEFNASQTKYKVVQEAKGSYRDTLQAAILADKQGKAPNLVHVFEVGSQLAYDSGIFMPVSDIGTFDTSDYIAPVLNYYTIDGKVNSIPFNSSSPVLYINTDKLVAAGYPADYVPDTLEDMIKVVETARAKNVDGANISFALHGWYFEQWMAEQGAPLVNNDNGRSARATEVNLTSPAAMAIGNFLSRLGKENLYSYTGKAEDWDGSDAIFTSGKAIFHITSTADLGNIGHAVEGKFTMGVGKLPILSGTKRNGTVIGGGSVWVTKNHTPEELEGARDFILFMTNTKNMVSWHKLTGYYPVRNSSVDQLKAEGWFTSDAKQLVAFNQLLNTIPNAATAGALAGTLLDNRTIMEQAMQKILQGGDVKNALTEAKVLADAKLKEYNANF